MAPVLQNKQIIFKSRPEGFPTDSNFELVTTEIAQDLRDSQDVLVQLLDLSVDPYLRGRMNAGKSYFPGFELGKVLTAAVSPQCPHRALLTTAVMLLSSCMLLATLLASSSTMSSLLAAPEQWRCGQSSCVQQQQFQGG